MNLAHFYLHDPNAPTPQRNSIGVCCLVLLENRVLVEHRADNDSWGFIGGGVNPNESLCEGAARELLEETGIVLAPVAFHFLSFFDHPQRIAQYPDGNIVRLFSSVFWTRLQTEPALVCSEESRALRFVTQTELLQLPIVMTHRDIMEQFLQVWHTCTEEALPFQ